MIDELGKHLSHQRVVDYSSCEQRGLYLEGTGSLVLDHVNKIAYVSLSQAHRPRTRQAILHRLRLRAGAVRERGDDGRPIYHTNVMMCVGSEFALVGLDMIPDCRATGSRRSRLEASGKEVIELKRDQIAKFAGNAIELHNDSEKLLVLSNRAAEALTSEQRKEIEQYARLLPLALPTIELAGGSARCMLATIHLPRVVGWCAIQGSNPRPHRYAKRCGQV